jgi:glycosyltransferase involved in cell wall biosynthesis
MRETALAPAQDPALTVSVVIPTYNRAGLLARALRSALAESRPGDEVIVVDDGSTDDTEGLVRVQGPMVRYVRTAHVGAGAARNAGVRAATGDLIAFLDSDDDWVPGKLSWQRAVMAWRPDLVCVFSDFGCAMMSGERLHHRVPIWSGDARSWDEVLGAAMPSNAIPGLPADAPAFRLYAGDLYETYLKHWSVFTGTVVVRRARAGDALRFAEDVPTLEDVECFARLAGRGPVGYMDCETAWQYEHAGPRLTDADAARRARAALVVVGRVYGGDAGFLDRHRPAYEAAMDAHRDIVVRALLADGRAADARRELAAVFHPSPALVVLSRAPGALVQATLAVRRAARRLFAPALRPT